MFWLFIGLVVLAGIGNGMRKFKGEQYLANKYDESKKNK